MIYERLGSGYNIELASSEAHRWAADLRSYGEGEESNWGFRIYRTTYTPESDRDFITGLRIISRHLRESCFAYPGNDDTPNKQVWARMKNTIIEDRAQFDCVSPTVIQRHFQTWIEEQGYHLLNDPSPDPSLKGSSSASYRFCIIIDAEALRNLLRFSPSADPQPSHRDRIGVKVLDVECHEDAEDYEPPFDQGWMWAGPNNLAEIWFDIIDYGIEEIYDTDELGRPVIMEY